MAVPDRHALVTGATGAVGVPLVRHLAANGYTVTAVARRRPNPALLPPSVRVVTCDVRSGSDLISVMPPGAVVFHLAGRKRGHEARDFEVNVEGTKTVLRAAARVGAARVVIASSIHVYGWTAPGKIADETTPLHPRTHYARSKVAAEQEALALAEAEAAPPLVILRLAAAYGPEAGGNVERMERMLRMLGPLAVIPWNDRVRTLLHVEDAAAALLLAATHPAAAGETFNVTDGRLRTMRQIVTAVCEAAGRPVPKLLRVSPAWVSAAARVASALGISSSHEESETLAALLYDMAVDGSRFQSRLQFVPVYDLPGIATR